MVPRISLVIPAYNCEKTLKKTLDSITFQSIKPDEILIAYSESSDNTRNILNDYTERLNLRIIESPGKKFGPAEARNIAASQCICDILAFTDTDCIISENWIEKILEIFNDDEITVAAGPVNGAEPENIIELYQYIFGLNIIAEDKKFNKFILFESFGHTANLAVRRRAFEKNKGFNQKLFFAEDHDFCARLLQEEANILYFTSIMKIKHLYRSDLKKFCCTTLNYSAAHRHLLKNYYDGFTIKISGRKKIHFQTKFHYIFEPFSLTKKIGILIFLSIAVSPLLLIPLIIYLIKIKSRLSLKIQSSDCPEKNKIIVSETDEYKFLLLHICENLLSEIGEIYGYVKYRRK